MIGILLTILMLVYISLSWVIIYHLRTYTISRHSARRAVIVFIIITVILFSLQLIFFFLLPQSLSLQEVQYSEPFGL